MSAAVTAVVVCYDEQPQELRGAVDALLAQTLPPQEILLVDNSADGHLAAELDGHHPTLRAIALKRNAGYPPAVNVAAREATGRYLFCLNPDAQAAPDCLEKLVAAADADERVAIAGAQILLEDGKTRNAGANPLHPTGISPSGGYGEPREHGEPRDVIVASGACCLMRRDTFNELGGFVDEFFLYYDDADYAWRANIAGRRVVYVPQATVTHGYEFARRGRKWFYLERNRLFSVLANYEARTLLLLAPLLLLTELGLLAVAALQGWLPQKLEAYGALAGLRGRIAEQRALVARTRRRSDAEVLELVSVRLDSQLLPAAGALLANAFCVPYMWIVRRLLGR
jgi:GT2 family glycosyltransferase